MRDTKFWTEERTADLRRMLAEGASSGDIAYELGNGLTRNAVIGKAHRLGIALNGNLRKNTGVPGVKRVRRKHIARARPARPVALLRPLPRALPQPPLRIPDEQYSNLAEALLALQPGQCRWPVAEAKFCPRRATHKSYCQEHFRLAQSYASRWLP